jgi:hypothetical protein
VTYDRVEYVAAVLADRSSFPDDLLDLIDALAGAVTVEAGAVDRSSRFRRYRLVTLAPHDAPVDHAINASEFADRSCL